MHLAQLTGCPHFRVVSLLLGAFSSGVSSIPGTGLSNILDKSALFSFKGRRDGRDGRNKFAYQVPCPFLSEEKRSLGLLWRNAERQSSEVNQKTRKLSLAVPSPSDLWGLIAMQGGLFSSEFHTLMGHLVYLQSDCDCCSHCMVSCSLLLPFAATVWVGKDLPLNYSCPLNMVCQLKKIYIYCGVCMCLYDCTYTLERMLARDRKLNNVKEKIPV